LIVSAFNSRVANTCKAFVLCATTIAL
jgi:hypothetical protein